MNDGITLRHLQEYIKGKDHTPELGHDYFLKLVEEIGELADAIRKGRNMVGGGGIKGTIEEELYDVLYYVVALANIHGADLEECFRLKEELNISKYGVRSGTGQ